MSPKIKIFYLNGRGRAEVPRWICEIGGMPYEDVRLSFDEWLKIKPNAVFGQLPEVEYDGVMIAQSKAITRFLSKKAGLAGKDDMEQCQIDMFVDLVSEMFESWIIMATEMDDEHRKPYQKRLEEVRIPTFLKIVDEKLAKAGGKYLVSGRLTLADLEMVFYLKSLVDPTDPFLRNYLPCCHAYRTSGIYEKHPGIVKYIEGICNEPKLKAWLDKRPSNEDEAL